jgi:hypothetical protein
MSALEYLRIYQEISHTNFTGHTVFPAYSSNDGSVVSVFSAAEINGFR